MSKKSWDDILKEYMKDNAVTESSPNDVFDFLKEKYPNGIEIELKTISDKKDYER